tara:strand:+ start:634 stop:1146 length:513 start_codon:yes stop_codon:yes gene_type:complete
MCPPIRLHSSLLPQSDTTKELVLIDELELLLEHMSRHLKVKALESVTKPIFERVAVTLESNNFQVAGRASQIFDNSNLSPLFGDRYREIIPVVFGSLIDNKNGHWNESISDQVCAVACMFLASLVVENTSVIAHLTYAHPFFLSLTHPHLYSLSKFSMHSSTSIVHTVLR